MADTVTSIALITKYSTQGFDKVYKADATSSVLAKDSSLVQFTGAKTVKVAKLNFGGLNDYSRNNFGDERVNFADGVFGYGASMAGLQWEEHTLRMDRAAKYVIEEFDNEESGDIVIGHALTEINRTQIVPEVDAYCWSTIYQNAGKVVSGAVTAAESLTPLNNAYLWEDEHEVPAENQIVVMSPAYLNLLRSNNSQMTRFMQQGDWDKNVSFKMTKYEGRDFVIVPPTRFMSKFDFIATGGLGYKAASDAVAIDFIVMPKDAACHIVKFQKTRILSGDVATAMSNMDGYVLLARIYHDVIVFDNRKVAIYAHTGSGATSNVSDATAGILNVAARVITENGKVKNMFWMPGDKFVTLVTAKSGTTPTVGTTVITSSTIANYTPIKLGDTLASGATFYIVDATNTVIGSGTAE